jgi:hypothetical protein
MRLGLAPFQTSIITAMEIDSWDNPWKNPTQPIITPLNIL